ncbi:MAG: hypothetical protein ACOYNN_02825 [Terrimicrobiaceae bacterium]
MRRNGARPSGWKCSEERRRLGQHFSVIPYRACTEQDWDRAISLAWKLRDKGLTVPWLDVVIVSGRTFSSQVKS